MYFLLVDLYLQDLIFLFKLVMFRLHGNPVCAAQNQLNISQYCQSATVVVPEPGGSADNSTLCQPCDLPFERIPLSPIPCICAVPVYVDYRLKSPGFWNFIPYESQFQQYLSSGLSLSLYQLEVSTFMWEEGPRLRMDLKLFPNNTPYFNANEVLRLNGMFTGWQIPDSDIFGPYELLSFNRGWYNASMISFLTSLFCFCIVHLLEDSVRAFMSFYYDKDALCS